MSTPRLLLVDDVESVRTGASHCRMIGNRLPE